ncbi:prolyl oligopeptidase family serine peptidase [Neobacillus mesonae]|uniref:prolyl oligopeptidase family serine peptidase n=1 Tax=Neobacillus mesonae TaxID=1193713 RepID=UPI00083197ED|nr:prolyl oligopeptidase family serine peptidase [Neobacillus mesonae]
MTLFTKKDHIVENFHGVEVADPYRWLEDADSQESREWTEAQNHRTNQYLSSFTEREQVKETLTNLQNYAKYSLPQKEGDYYYFHKNDGLLNQSIFYRSKSLEKDDIEIVLDPNSLNEEGTAAITNITFNDDGSKMVYAISYNGSDWQEVRIRDLITGKDFPEVLKGCKFSSFAWNKNRRGFYYNRYPQPGTVPPEEESFYNRVYWHQVGTDQEEDRLVYEDPGHKEFSFAPRFSDDDKYLLLTVFNGTEPKNRIYYQEVEGKGEFIPLINDGEAYYTFLGNDGVDFYFLTNRDTPKGKVISVNLHRPKMENWQELISEQEDPISFIKIIDHKFVVCSMHNAYDRLKVYDKNGVFQQEISLPSYITVTGITGEKSSQEMFAGYTSFLYPTKMIKCDMKNYQITPVFETAEQNEADAYETNQVWYRSKDGTKIPMFLTHKKDLDYTADHPVLLYGYGGYNISLTPSFSPAQRMWIQSGGIYAVANIRGGGEFGEDWHLEGILEKKQNSFDDFIAAAEWLIENQYTNPKRIAIMGASNGGMLVGACITQRPDLYGAALCLVPVTDMLRFHRFTVGRFWTTEFGNAETNPEQFNFMFKYSPLHNVKEGVEYPPTLITTADTDDRVVPLHAKKFAAALQAVQSGTNPILLRVEKNAGHGLGKPTSKVIEEQTDLYTFLFKELRLDL